MMVRRSKRIRALWIPPLRQLAALAIAGWAVALLITWDNLAPVRLGLYAAPLIMVTALALAAINALRRARLTALVMLSVASGLFYAQAPTLLRALAPTKATLRPDDALHVISLSNRTLNQDMTATARMIRNEDADLFILQEVADPGTLIATVASLPGPNLHHCSGHTFVVFSPHPLGPPHQGAVHGVLACPVDLPTGRVWVGSVHLPRGIDSQRRQLVVVDHILAMLEEMPGPKIIAGDFNATPLTTPIRRMEARLQNAFAAAGKGFGFTFPTPARRIGAAGPFLQIDYIFHSQDFQTIAASVKRDHPPGADHLPVQALLRLRPGNRG